MFDLNLNKVSNEELMKNARAINKGRTAKTWGNIKNRLRRNKDNISGNLGNKNKKSKTKDAAQEVVDDSLALATIGAAAAGLGLASLAVLAAPVTGAIAAGIGTISFLKSKHSDNESCHKKLEPLSEALLTSNAKKSLITSDLNEYGPAAMQLMSNDLDRHLRNAYQKYENAAKEIQKLHKRFKSLDTELKAGKFMLLEAVDLLAKMSELESELREKKEHALRRLLHLTNYELCAFIAGHILWKGKIASLSIEAPAHITDKYKYLAEGIDQHNKFIENIKSFENTINKKILKLQRS